MKKEDSALTVNKGVEQPPIVNPNVNRLLKKRPTLAYNIEDYKKGILNHDVSILSQAITLVESTLPEHRRSARELVSACYPYSGRSLRIGITGVPGVGKSTFIEAFGKHITSQGHTLAVLAIDPSSERSKGSILGDKTRMESLANDPKAFIRPSPSSGTLGGVARKTRESVVLCEAAGFDTIFIETVGVGQSETAVSSMTDFFLLLMLAGAGDGLQGIKRGIMEMSDLIVIHKADGNNVEKALQARSLYINALHMFPPSPAGWVPTALTASSYERTGLDGIEEKIRQYVKLTKGNGYFEQKRREQSRYWMEETLNENILSRFYDHPDIRSRLEEYRQKVVEGKIESFTAADELLHLYFNSMEKPCGR